MAAVPQKEQQKIFEGFQKLRGEQQQIVAELTRYAAELRETKSVLASIERWDNTGRKFYYRCVDALLEYDAEGMEKKMKDNIEDLENKVRAGDVQLQEKATAVREYTEKHQIRFVPQ